MNAVKDLVDLNCFVLQVPQMYKMFNIDFETTTSYNDKHLVVDAMDI